MITKLELTHYYPNGQLAFENIMQVTSLIKNLEHVTLNLTEWMPEHVLGLEEQVHNQLFMANIRESFTKRFERVIQYHKVNRKVDLVIKFRVDGPTEETDLCPWTADVEEVNYKDRATYWEWPFPAQLSGFLEMD